MTKGVLPPEWLRPCPVIRCERQKPLIRGAIGRLREALAIAGTAVHDGGRSDRRANHYPRDRDYSVPVTPARRLSTPSRHVVEFSVTGFGERELSVSREKDDDDDLAVRFRFWMPLDDLPVDPDFSGPDTCLANLRNYIRLIAAHLPAISKAVRSRSIQSDVGIACDIAERAKRVAAVATTWTRESVSVESNTPWSPMIVDEYLPSHHRGKRLGDPDRMAAWANPPCMVARIDGAKDDPLILSVTPHRTEMEKATPIEVMRAAAMLPQTGRLAA